MGERLVMLLDPDPNPDCPACDGSGEARFRTADGDDCDERCWCCPLDERCPTAEDIVRHLREHPEQWAEVQRVMDEVTRG